MKERKILKNKAYLYLTEFFAGMAVMAVELGASRLLAPYFSSSQIVWTIIISTIMIAMALGNIYGGRSADKNPDPDRLYRRLLIAAVWTAAIPVLGKYIILLFTGILIVTISSNLLIAAGFLACMAIFVFPCFLLGTVTPSLTKYAVRSLDDSGSTVGRLGAANTVGSIIGTFTPTFITIPTVGTSVTFLIFSGILLALASSFQQMGIQYTTVGRAGFITACYIVIVPILGHFFLRKKCGATIWIAVALALAGLYLLCITDGFSVGKGDLLVMVCSLLFSLHILVIDYFSPKVDGVKMSCIQFFVCGFLCAIPAVFTEHIVLADIFAAWAPILYAGVMSCGVAYTLQIIGQKDMNPTVASLILSLESCISVLAGWILLNQKLSARELSGCVLMFAAIILAQLPSGKKA